MLDLYAPCRQIVLIQCRTCVYRLNAVIRIPSHPPRILFHYYWVFQVLVGEIWPVILLISSPLMLKKHLSDVFRDVIKCFYGMCVVKWLKSRKIKEQADAKQKLTWIILKIRSELKYISLIYTNLEMQCPLSLRQFTSMLHQTIHEIGLEEPFVNALPPV